MKSILVAVVVFLGLFLAPSAFYVISETEQGVILKFSRPIKVIVNRVNDADFASISEEIRSATEGSRVKVARGPGLYMKVPFLHTLQRFDARLLEYDEEPSDVVTLEKIKPRVDSYARWRVRNPLLFMQSIQREELAGGRLRDVIRSTLRKELGRHYFHEVIRSSTRPIVYATDAGEDEETQAYHPPITVGREAIMATITKICDAKAREYGMHIIDVRIKRADLPPENASSVFDRMKAERQRIATRFEEEGKREATRIRAETDRKVKIVLAEAAKKDLEIRGNADAQAADIYANGFEETLPTGEKHKVEGFGAEPDFFNLVRKLQTLEKAINPGDRLILTTESPLLEVFSRMITKQP
jgi:modulator of FtsH protease HflC